MAESERLVKFQLLGQEFAFYTGASEEEMDAILRVVRKHIEDNGGDRSGPVSVTKVAVMACLNLASRYIALKHDFETYQEGVEERARSLNEKLDTAFLAEK